MMKAVYGADHQACVLVISGSITEKEIMETFDRAVPAQSRGAKKQEWLECTGGCVKVFEFESLDLTSAVVGKQTADPAATVLFKRKDCVTLVNEANKIAIHIKR